ncbi:MAG: S8 family serine peptidase [Myxococcota bacterium]
MDPALWEVIRLGGDPAEVVVRLELGEPLPPELTVVARFGAIATGRVARADIRSVRSHRAVRSLKASIPIAGETGGAAPRVARGRGSPAGSDGSGVLVGVIDWGVDFAAPAFRTLQGDPRLVAVWDQRGGPGPRSPRYGYGSAFDRDDLAAALQAHDPYTALGYHPGDADPAGDGAHGTHVLDLAGGTYAGVAPGADLAFVHLSDPSRADNALGTSARLLEALHFLSGVAGDRPCVVNLSLGRHAGPHDGTTLVELAFEAWLHERPGRALVQSAGNYHHTSTHAAVAFGPAPVRVAFTVPDGDTTANELDLWYPGDRRLRIRLFHPGGEPASELLPGEHGPVCVGGVEVGRAYHRVGDPNNGDHNAHLFLDADRAQTAGRWEVELEGLDANGGTAHLWLERDPVRAGQARFDVPTRATTTGTICNAPSAVTVGALDPNTGGPAPFSSAGPTRDGRPKPDLCAPGVEVVAARSARPGATEPEPEPVSKSGTSMAAPQVAGAAALLLAIDPTLTALDVRHRLIAASDPLPDPSTAPQLGRGVLRADRAVEQLLSERAPSQESPMTETDELSAEPSLDSIDPPLPFAEDFPDAHREPPNRGAQGALGSSAGAAAVFDHVRRTGALPAELAPELVLVGAPGRRPYRPATPGDLVVIRALGEGRVAATFRVVTAGGPRVGVAALADGRRSERVLTDGGALRHDVLLFRVVDAAPPTEVLPAYEVGAVDHRTDIFVETPVYNESWLVNREGTGLVIRRAALRTPAELAADTPARFAGVDWVVNAAGRLAARIDLLVYHPATTAGGTTLPSGTHPLAIIVHGNHSPADPSYQGYSGFTGGSTYLQEALARIGVISVSVNLNAANGWSFVETRARLIAAAIAEVKSLARTDPRYRRKIDFDRVALIGHSRGGDAIVRAMRMLPSGVTARALIQLAPTDQTGLLAGTPPVVPAVAHPVDWVTRPETVTARDNVLQLIVWGSRDGDVSGMEDVRTDVSVNPFRHYDRSSAQRAFQFWHGATHNRFNRQWTDLQEGGLVQLTPLPNNLLDRSDQEARTIEVVRAWLAFALYNERSEAEVFDGRRPTAVAPTRRVSAMWKFGRRLRTIDQFDDTAPSRNTLGGANVSPPTGVFDEVTLANENPPGAGLTAPQLPHIDRGLRFSPAPPIALSSTSATVAPAWRTTLPPGDRDLHDYDLITFRVTKKYGTPYTAPVVRVRLIGATASVSHTETAVGRLAALPIQRRQMSGPTVVWDLTKFHYETWEVDLTPYRAAMSVRDVRFVELEIDTTPGEPVYIDTLSLVKRP